MNFVAARVVSSEEIYEDTFLQWYSAPEISAAAGVGQFVMLRCRGDEELDPLLPRAMSIHRLREDDNETQWAILFYVVGRGTRWLAGRRAGDIVFTYGPLGKGFAVKEGSRNLLLVAGGIGVAPLIWLSDEGVRLGKNVTLLLGARRASLAFPLQRLPAEVEVTVMTEDGSLGGRGLVSEAFERYLPWCDQGFACGPPAMFEALAAVRRRLGLRKPLQILMEERMCCGTGICYSCVAMTPKGARLVCKDGPMFEVQDVFR